ncbi:MAG: hypothetical protein ACRDZM_03945 [Acidimicrobiia bacterium]
MTNEEGRPQVEYGSCPVCGYVMLPVLEMSPCGHDAPPVLSPLDEAGVVYSWTRVWPDDTGQTLAMADFLGGRLRVTAPLLDGGEVVIGDRVRLTVGSGTPLALYPDIADG